MLIINGKPVMESTLTVHNVKLQKAEKPKVQAEDPPKQKAIVTKPEEQRKMSEVEQKPKETAALDLPKKKGKAKKRPIHGAETRNKARR